MWESIVAIAEFIAANRLWAFTLLGAFIIVYESRDVDEHDASLKTRADFEAAREERRGRVVGLRQAGYPIVATFALLATADTIVRMMWPNSRLELAELAHPLVIAVTLFVLVRIPHSLVDIPRMPRRLLDQLSSLRNACIALGAGAVLVGLPEAFAFDDTLTGYAVYGIGGVALVTGSGRLWWLERRFKARSRRVRGRHEPIAQLQTRQAERWTRGRAG